MELVTRNETKLLTFTPSEPFIVKEKSFNDERGWFIEEFNEEEFNKITGLGLHFIQDNISYTRQFHGRGLHWQKDPYPQQKLIRVLQGDILDYAVCIDESHPNFGKIYEFHLKNTHMNSKTGDFEWVFIPKGFAHGFYAIENSVIQYKVDNVWVKQCEESINMPDLIPTQSYYRFSEKDANAPFFEERFGKEIE